MKTTNINFIYYCFLIIMAVSCKNEDFKDMPQNISLKDLVVEPVYGGCNIKWTPNPDDKNFVFLSTEFKDHDNKNRCYNVSRYGSSLVTPNVPDSEDKRTPEVVLEIRDLVNQTYSLRFYAYNQENNRIDLGSMDITPGDYTESIPDSIYGVNVKAGGKRFIELSWSELPLKTSSTLHKIFFKFKRNGEVVETKEYDPGVRHDKFQMAEIGQYEVEYGTISEKGKTWNSRLKNPIDVIEYHTYWDAKDKINWLVTGNSVQESEGPYKNLIDGKKDTFWASNWGHSQLPYELIVELDRVMNMCGVMMQQRQNCAPGYHRCVKEFEIYTKENEADSWKSEPDYKGIFADNKDGDHLERQDFIFGSVIKAKYVKIKFIKAMFNGGDGVDGNGYNIAMAEFGILEEVAE